METLKITIEKNLNKTVKLENFIAKNIQND